MTTQQRIIDKYGQPDKTYLAKYCMEWEVQKDFPWFPAKSFFVNKDFQIKLASAFSSLQKNNLHTEIKTFDGCYNDRSIRGSGSLSQHAFAMAIDLNASLNPMVVKPFDKITPQDRQGKWSGQFIAIMKNAGIFYGGDFSHRPDPMHWGLFFL